MRPSQELRKRAPWVRLVREPGPAPSRVVISKPSDIVRLIRGRAQTECVEVFYLVALDAQNNTIATTELTRGILNSSLVHPREVFRVAIALGAAGIVVAHNHPSGAAAPSPDDRAVTNQLAQSGRVVDIPLCDHIIIGEGDSYFSFAEAGLL